MKILTILVLLQTCVLLLVFGKIVGIEDEMTPTTLGAQNALVADDSVDAQPESNSNNTNLYSNEERLRQIIREELDATLESRSEPDKQTDPVIASGPRDQTETERQREQVAQQLEYYANVGRISDAQMQKLQMDIAKLDDAGRTEMLSRLSRAFNSETLEGRL